jgi:hypothetical protein
MPHPMIIPTAWMAEAGVEDFKPTRREFEGSRGTLVIVRAVSTISSRCRVHRRLLAFLPAPLVSQLDVSFLTPIRCREP